MYEIDENQIRQWWSVFNKNDSIVEIRLLGKNSYSGYFKDVDTLLKALRPILDHNNSHYYGSLQAYFTLNEINEDLYSREQRNTFVKKPKSTTTDGDITRRKFILIDLDPNRSAGISSSDSEFELAHLKAVQVYRYLIANGFKEPMITTSGNGYHCYLPCDMPNDDTHTDIVKRFLQSLSKTFSDGNVEIDEKVFNPARIDKLIGTWAKKGSDGDDRKWRMAKFVKIPDDLSPNDVSLFEKIANLLPKEEPKVYPNQRNYKGVSQFNLVVWLNEHGIKYREKKKADNTTLYELEYCPWVDTHSDKKKWDSALFVDAQGKVTFNCTHSHCKNKTWHDVRLFYEPNAYDRQQYQQPTQYRQYQPTKHKYEIKSVSPELGEKWLSMSSIKKVDLSQIECVKTGFKEIDKNIVGLNMAEVSILTGSNACVDCDTEYFNGFKWKKISDYTFGDKVLQYNMDGSAELITPQRYIKSPCDELYLIQSVTGVDQCVSSNHDLVYMTSKGNLAKKSVSAMLLIHEKSSNGFSGKFYTTFNYTDGIGIDLSNEEIRLMCAIICDGSFSDRYRDTNIVRINLKKERKKQRLEALLRLCGIQYRKEFYVPKDKEFNSYIFRAPRREKEFGEYWYSCSQEQLAIVADEIVYWDGCIKEGKRQNSSYSSVNKRNIDFVQFAFASVGIRTSIHIDNRVGKLHSNGKYIYKSVCYSLTICKTKNPSLVNPKRKKKIKTIKTKDGFKYCFTVPSGMLVLRRNGNINVTGNSGKSSLLNTMLLNIIQQGTPCALWSGELPPYILKTWIQMAAAGRNHLRLSAYGDGKYYVPNNIAESIDKWMDGKFFLYNNDYGNTWEQIFNDMGELVKANVKVFALDNLFSLNIDLLDGDKNNKQRELILQIKDFAKKNKVHIILVAHPRKVVTFLRKNDISGSSDLQNAVDDIFIIHRVNNDFFKSGADFFGQTYIQRFQGFGNVVEVAKNRMYGIVDLLVGLHYEIESRRFKNDISEDTKYGWEIQPVQSHIQYEPNDSAYSDNYTVDDVFNNNDTIIAPF